MTPKRSIRLVLLVLAVIAFAGLLSSFLVPRKIIVESASGSPAGLTVHIHGSPFTLQSATTDAQGVAQFGRGFWSPPLGKARYIAVKVDRGSDELRYNIEECPRWGPLRVYTK